MASVGNNLDAMHLIQRGLEQGVKDALQEEMEAELNEAIAKIKERYIAEIKQALARITFKSIESCSSITTSVPELRVLLDIDGEVFDSKVDDHS